MTKNSKSPPPSSSSWHGAKMDFSQSMNYGDYLALHQILSAQRPRSNDNNELLFIIQHQTSELWMKLMLHELHGVLTNIRDSNLAAAFKMLSRVARIMDQLVHAWDVLATMTPSEYTLIRPHLGNSSAFQSAQYREIEFVVGNKNEALLRMHTIDPEAYDRLNSILLMPSLYDEAVFLLSRQGFEINPARLAVDPRLPTVADESVNDAWLQVYKDPTKYWELYDLAEKLVDLETSFRTWRFRHVTTVERIIGHKRGTGGTEGVNYLKKMLDVVLFPELFNLRTQL